MSTRRLVGWTSHVRAVRRPAAVLALVLGPAAAGAQRQRFSLDPGWRFTRGDVPGAQQLAFDDHGWRVVDLPHDWSIEGPFAEANPGGGRIGYLPTGIGWYRRSFTLPRGAEHEVAWLELDGVYMNADVWLNGTLLGHRPYGYAPQWYDLTPHLARGRNVIAVRVDNSAQPNSRYYSGSGITRHTWLTITDPLHVAPRGTVVTTPSADTVNAQVVIRTRLERKQPAGPRGAPVRTVVLRSIVVDSADSTVATVDTTVVLDAASERDIQSTLNVARPRLWSPDRPAMYTLRQLVLERGRVIDSVTTPFGIRTIAFDADRGFLLNGQQVKLRGVNLHDDGGAVGTAVPERVWARRLELLKIMGANAIRTAHNPFAPEFLDLADRLGFLVMDEAFDEWRSGKVAEGYHKYFDTWAERDLADQVRRDRNHPSVVLWSAGNEIGEQAQPGGDQVLRRLLGVIHRLDPTRPVTTGNDHIAADDGAATPAFLGALDVVGYNYVDRWHERRELYASEDRHDHPDWAMIGTESVALGGVRGAYPLGPDSTVVHAGYLSRLVRPEQLWKFVAMHDYFAGDFMWTGIDYLGETRWPSKGAASGAIDMAGFPKDAFYFYQSRWTAEPVLHLLPHWTWPGREGQVIPVVAFTNCDAVELFLNGTSFGVKRLEFPRQGTSGGWNSYARPPVAATTADLHLAWDVPYAPGVLRAVGTTREGRPCATAQARTAGVPAALRLRVDRDTITDAPGDVLHVTAELVDAHGTLVPVADPLVRFAVTGGRLVATDNGNLRDLTPFQSAERRVFSGLVLAIAESSAPGRLRVTATAAGLPPATVDVVVRHGARPPTLR